MREETFDCYSVADLRAIGLYRDEIDRVMASLGVNSVAELDRSHVVMPPASPSPFDGGSACITVSRNSTR